MIQIQELYRQIQCQYSNEIYKKVNTKRYGISSCMSSETPDKVEELHIARYILEFIIDNPEYCSSCNINKLLQNINYL